MTKMTRPTDLTVIQSIDGDWQVDFNEKYGGPGRVRFTNLQDWSTHRNRSISRFVGTAFYTKRFNARHREAAFISIGTVHHAAELALNGLWLGKVRQSTRLIEIPAGLLKIRGNVLIIKVSNAPKSTMRENKGSRNGKGRYSTTNTPPYTVNYQRHLDEIIEADIIGSKFMDRSSNFKKGQSRDNWDFDNTFLAKPAGLLGPVELLWSEQEVNYPNLASILYTTLFFA